MAVDEGQNVRMRRLEDGKNNAIKKKQLHKLRKSEATSWTRKTTDWLDDSTVECELNKEWMSIPSVEVRRDAFPETLRNRVELS